MIFKQKRMPKDDEVASAPLTTSLFTKNLDSSFKRGMGLPMLAFGIFILISQGGCVSSGTRSINIKEPKSYYSQQITKTEKKVVKEEIFLDRYYFDSPSFKSTPLEELVNWMKAGGLEPRVEKKQYHMSKAEVLLLVEEFNKLNEKAGSDERIEIINVPENGWTYNYIIVTANNHNGIYAGFTNLFSPSKILWSDVAKIPNIDTSKPLKFYDMNYGRIALRTGILPLLPTVIFENGRGAEVARVIKDKEGNIKVERIKLLPEIQPLLDKTRIENLHVLTFGFEDEILTFVKESFPFEMVLEIDGKGRKRFIPYKESKMFK